MNSNSSTWMMPYAMLGFTKVPEEQGEWAAQTALHILAGASPAGIPIVPNRKWDIWANERHHWHDWTAIRPAAR